MNELVDKLRPEFQDKEYRDAYADECLNMMIATQIRVLREQHGMTQKQLAEAAGMGQPRIPLLEDAGYENWTVSTLKRLAKAFDVALSVRFEAFSSVILDFANMTRESLQRPSFAQDPLFSAKRIPSRHRQNGRKRFQRRRARLSPFPRKGNPRETTGAMAASSNFETNWIGAQKKEPARETLGNGAAISGGQAGFGEHYA